MSSKRYRNLTRRETHAAAVAACRLRGCICERPRVHVIRPSTAGTTDGHVQVRHSPLCPMATAGTVYDMILHPEVTTERDESDQGPPAGHPDNRAERAKHQVTDQ